MLAGARARLKFKLDKAQTARLDGTSIPLEEAGGRCAVVEVRLCANCSKDADGKATAAFSATELAEADRSLVDLPPSEEANASEARSSAPAVGSGATRSPDVLPTAGETADAASAPDAAARPLVRGRSEEPVVTAAAAAKADGKSAKRTRGRAE